MADTSHPTDVPQSDLKAHARGYSKFVNVFKWGAIVSFVVAAAVVYGIS